MPGTLSLALISLAQTASMIIETSFPDTCSISRPTNTIGDYGTATPSYPNVSTNVPCSWGPAGKNAQEYIRALKITGVTVYAVTLTADVDVKPQDRIVIAARGDEPQRTFEVKGPPIRNAGISLYVLCTREE